MKYILSNLSMWIFSALAIVTLSTAHASEPSGKTGINARYVSFNPIHIEGQKFVVNDALQATSMTAFEVGGFYPPPSRMESIQVKSITNPTGRSSLGTITVRVDIQGAPNSESELELAKLIPFTVYKVKIETFGSETVPMADVETYLAYFGTQADPSSPIKYAMYSVLPQLGIKSSADQLQQMMEAYRKLCSRYTEDCKTSSGFHDWLLGEVIQQEHNRAHREVAYEQYVSYQIEAQREVLARAGKDISRELKQELLDMYLETTKKYRNYSPLTLSIDNAYVAKLKREAQVLKLEILEMEK